MRRFAYIFMMVVMLGLGVQQLAAKTDEVDIYELSLDENIATPEIRNDKQADRVQDYQYEMAVAMRDDEVIVVTIPASQLFDANDTVLNKLGEAQLKPFLSMLTNPGFYKMLLVMHSDNTGSSAYTLNLTRQRVNAIFDWFEENGSVDYVVPYALGETDPIVDNNSVENRKLNRRLEIYLVPDKVMLQQAKKGKINIRQKAK